MIGDRDRAAQLRLGLARLVGGFVDAGQPELFSVVV
jgi:hypothetical protein